MEKILIGGDSLTLRNGVTRDIYYKAGLRVSYAKNYDELEKELKRESRILAIIIDNDLPVFSFPIHKIQQFELPSPRPLLILTAQKDHLVALAHALQAGFDEFLAKPVGDELIALLKYKTVINQNTNQ